MNRKIGMSGSLINLASVIGFALSMIIDASFAGYLASIFIALGFVLMASAFCQESEADHKAAGYAALVFSGMYAALILLVYFAQMTAVRLGRLNAQAMQILDYQQFGLFFSYDLLGYGIMALATLFAGLTIKAAAPREKWLKALLLIHGIFFSGCLILPMLGLFSAEMENADWIGVAILEVWCLYFAPVGILSFLHFRNGGEKAL
ncbi:MAG: hypothetical protein VB051_09920 [Candidatus Pelethousia sp.]|nr:hypothetical protein [Candidatus Pelethousia sp.]